MRIVSLLPAATEMLCALGARESLVGVSHECDYPPDVAGLSVLTRSRLALEGDSARIHESVSSLAADALSIYRVDTARLRSLAPDLIVTQDLCDVCAVSYEDVCAAVREMAGARVVTLHPVRLDDLYRNVEEIGDATGRPESAVRLVDSLRRRLGRLSGRTRSLPQPSVLLLEWLQPAMAGGLWTADLAEVAGARALATAPGEHARTLSLDELADLDPDVVLIKPCGFTLPHTIAELPRLPEYLPWSKWRAARAGRVFIVDGNAYFNRSGPRLVDSAEILAACVNQHGFDDFRCRYAGAVRRLRTDLSIGEFNA